MFGSLQQIQPPGRSAPQAAAGLGHGQQAGAEVVEIRSRKLLLDISVGALPNGEGAGEQSLAPGGENEGAVAVIVGIFCHADQAAPLKRLESGGERGAVHGQQIRNRPHGWRLRAVQRHEQRKLTVGEVQRAEGQVEAAGQGTGGALHVQAEAMVPNEQCGGIRERIGT